MDDRAAKLLLKAVRMLPQREQDQVLTALFREALSHPIPVTEPVPFTRPLPGPAPPDVVMLSDEPHMRLGYPPDMPGRAAMLPVRLPPELHDRLRQWSNEQGFSMASVVRGLVERFLDQQGGKATRRRAAGRSGSKRATARG